ncbi:MAG: hypothetical protein HY791_01525 [Deltaproteobacteria bacterium]|nr:hypothetical protein [Deltaproteobacteria bacterium]
MIGVGPKLHLDSLQKLGLDRAARDQIAKSIEKSSDGAKVDPFNYVPLSVLARHAEKLGHGDFATRIRSALTVKPANAAKTKTELTSFPTPKTSLGVGVTRAAGSGSIAPAELASYSGPLGALLTSLAKQGVAVPDLSGSVNATDLAKVLSEHKHRLTHLPSSDKGLTRAQVDTLTTLVASRLAPPHEERSVSVTLDSTYRKMAEGTGAASGIGVYQKNQYEGFFVRRTEGANGKPGFVLSGFKSDRIAVALPKDCSLLVVDSQGNERAAKLPRTDATIDGKKLSTVEISRTLVEPDSKNRVFDPAFSIKVLDPKGAILFEQALAFDKVATWTSNELVRGTFDYKRSAKDELDRFVLDNAVPPGSKSATPIARRPSFSIDGVEGQGDRLSIQRDGQSFALDDLAMLLAPPKRATQAFAPEPKFGPKLTYELRDDPRTSPHLDDHNGGLGVAITNSQGKKAAFDSSLFQSLQARVGVGGVTITSPEGTELARFDPFDPSQDKNRRTKAS